MKKGKVVQKGVNKKEENVSMPKKNNQAPVIKEQVKEIPKIVSNVVKNPYLDPYAKPLLLDYSNDNISFVKTVDEFNSLIIKNGGIIPFCYKDSKYHYLFGRENKDFSEEGDGKFSLFGGRLRDEEEKPVEEVQEEVKEEVQEEVQEEIQKDDILSDVKSLLKDSDDEEEKKEEVIEEVKPKIVKLKQETITGETNLDLTIKKFWESSNGVLGKLKILRNYITDNFEKLFVINSKEYEGAVILLPVDYSQQISKYFRLSYEFIRYVLKVKNADKDTKKLFLEGKDMIEWFTQKDLNDCKKYFDNSNEEIIDFLSKRESL